VPHGDFSTEQLGTTSGILLESRPSSRIIWATIPSIRTVLRSSTDRMFQVLSDTTATAAVWEQSTAGPPRSISPSVIGADCWPARRRLGRSLTATAMNWVTAIGKSSCRARTDVEHVKRTIDSSRRRGAMGVIT
jgi:hypothetical protein